MNKIQKIFFGLMVSLLFSQHAMAATDWPQPKAGMNFDKISKVAVLEGGRKKPFDTFALESVRTITGKTQFKGFSPVELVFSWLTDTKSWEALPILDASYQPLQKQLHLSVEEGRISPVELSKNSDFILFTQTITSKQQEKRELNELEKQGGRLLQRLNLFYNIVSGSAIRVLPGSNGAWDNLETLAERYPNLSMLKSAPTLEAQIAAALQGVLSAYHDGDAGLFDQLSMMLGDLLKKRGGEVGGYPTDQQLEREVHFNHLKPFRWAWGIYVLAFMILLWSVWMTGFRLYWVGMFTLLAAFLMHSYGFYLRCVIAGRPPVTNMYESVIWVSFGIVLFSLIFEAIYRAKYFALASSALAALLLILADSVPTILDPSIDPLVPVLRSNYWLTIHVLTITLSYAAFALALGIGHVSTGYYIFRAEETSRIQRLNYLLYRSMQVGVVFLAAGTILGGVWANASWGRFWGWDPKEVWALIALLGYLSILHGRYAGWLRGFGLAIGSIVAFLLVVMAWYGVNFILGVGLHSYGFSSGGAKFMTIFLLIEMAWIMLAVIRYKFSGPKLETAG